MRQAVGTGQAWRRLNESWSGLLPHKPRTVRRFLSSEQSDGAMSCGQCHSWVDNQQSAGNIEDKHQGASWSYASYVTATIRDDNPDCACPIQRRANAGGNWQPPCVPGLPNAGHESPETRIGSFSGYSPRTSECPLMCTMFSSPSSSRTPFSLVTAHSVSPTRSEATLTAKRCGSEFDPR
jgi:hypothetical protein